MRKWLFKLLFKQLIPFKWVDGHKTEIARVAAYLSAALLLAKDYVPEAVPLAQGANAQLLLLLSLLGIEVGKQHREDKEDDE